MRTNRHNGSTDARCFPTLRLGRHSLRVGRKDVDATDLLPQTGSLVRSAAEGTAFAFPEKAKESGAVDVGGCITNLQPTADQTRCLIGQPNTHVETKLTLA